uniref:Fido domain-containing protein n=1 Tax=uncultured Alphaproteobacteria bacterium TaxID=91750 RepID=A0A6M4NNB3_9PROT|nr:hypothetical protein PlAlph_2740 [uncultured Alphaproteobacteria bacterium]
MTNIENISVTQPILCTTAAIDEFRGELQAMKGAERPVSNEDALQQSIAHIKSKTEQNDYYTLLSEITDKYNHYELDETTVNEFHKILLRNTPIAETEKGHYKQQLNPVYSYTPEGHQIDIFYETASPFETPQMTRELYDWTRKSLKNINCHPLLTIALFMLRFLIIHPFQDGNSRIARALTMFLLLKSGYAHLRFASLESAIENNKEEYYRCLRLAQDQAKQPNPDFSPWLLFFLRTIQRMQKQLRHQLLKVPAAGTLPPLSAKIIEFAATQNSITLQQTVEYTKANINTVKKHLAALTADELLIRRGSSRGSWYTLK